VLGLGDGGAHYGMIFDAGYPTFMLTYWSRDRKVAEKLPLNTVKSLSKDPAETVGLNDRGVIAEGYRAHINIIDFDKLQLHSPQVEFSLPAGRRRLTPKASGFEATIVNGKVTYRNGQLPASCRAGWCAVSSTSRPEPVRPKGPKPSRHLS
jgi:N-acyl-D-aspartate/D-glutamate deacylase